MNWKNLKQSKCPKCENLLIKGGLYFCIGCKFSISKGKLINIVGNPLDLEQEANKLLKHKLKNRNFKK